MKTLLVLAQHPDMAEAVRSATNPEHYRVLHRSTTEEAEPLLVHGLADACIVDVDLTGVQAIWLLEKLRRRAPKTPLLVVSAAHDPQWEEEAYLQGVVQVVSKPVRPRMLASLLDRLWAAPSAAPALPSLGAPAAPAPQAHSDTAFLTTGTPPASASQLLPVLRNFSGILTHSLNAEAMLKQFLVLLRDILSINRGVIFLRQQVNAFTEAASPVEQRRLRSYASLGISASLLEHFELSLDEGIGAHVLRLGRVLRRNAEEARQDLGAQKEFELLGGQVAVPVFDRETVIGVAVFDGRITGEGLGNSELEMIFHLLEPLGLAVKNIWLHDQLAGNHQMMAGILRELSSACVVVNRDLTILHANKTARKYFTRGEARPGNVEFSDLPEGLGSKIYQVLKTGSASPTFRYSPEQAPTTVYNVSIVPFQAQPGGAPTSALLIGENVTQSEQLRRLEVETANLRLVRTIAGRLAHEVNNSMLPLGIHQQLLREKWKDSEFRESLSRAMDEGVKRVSRLGAQMRYLAQEGSIANNPFELMQLIDDAHQEACKHQPGKTPPLEFHNAGKPIILNADREALKHAFAEVILNALQANPQNPKVEVSFETLSNGNGRPSVRVDIEDNGSGFSPEVLAKAPAPFFGTRTVGLGVGLVVAQRILQNHEGKLELLQSESGKPAVVRIQLPLQKPETLS